jgi:hypothetical protein
VNFSASDMFWIVMWISLASALWAIDRRTRRIEFMLSDALNKLGIKGVAIPEPSDEVKALAADPRKFIAAIKAYREQTGLGLHDAKEVVERFANKASFPKA